ncbi:MAG: CRTAC1 family protein [Terriglobia bacterium]
MKTTWAYSRRSFLKLLGRAGFGGCALRAGNRLLYGSQAANASAFPFERIPNSKCGITWSHQNGHSLEYYEPETTGAGCGFIDYDNDGWMDIYLVNSGKCDFYDPNPPLQNALYHNNRDGTFTDVTEKAGVGSGGYGQGAAVGDFDGDGWPDIYLTQYGRNVLYRNNHDGSFTDVTEKAGVAAPGWSSSAVWFDYDDDGKLDLFVCRFVDYSKEKNKICGNREIGVRYCIPSLYDPMPSWLFRNNGDGTFTDVSKESGIASLPGKAWGAVATDINNDGRMDLFVSNDTVANFLFANRGNGKFEEIGLQAGVAYSSDSVARSGMGVDSADYDQDGWMDLFVDNVDHEMYSLYHNHHDETFTDVAISNGIGMATYMMSGWGVKFFDYDNNGNTDLFIANGHPDDKIGEQYSAVTYREPLLLFRNTGGGFQRAFENVSTRGGPLFTERFAARGMAIGDFNNDGAVDVLIAVNNGQPMLLRNEGARGNHWLGLRLVGKKCNRDAVGARVTWQSGDFKRSVMKVGGGSYLSSHDPRVVLGMGARTKLDWVEIKWPQPSGLVQRLTNPPIDRYITVVEGQKS